MTQTTMVSQTPTDTKETIQQMPNKSKDIKVLSKTQNNMILGSEKLFRKSLTNAYTKLFSNEHDIALIPTSHGKLSIEKTHNIYPSLNELLKQEYDKKVFIGLGEDCEILFDLYVNYGIVFDGAIFINNVSNEHEMIYGRVIKNVYEKTKIYNLFGKSSNNRVLPKAHTNQLIPTLISPLTTSRFAQEAYGLICYDLYGKMFLDESKGRMALI